MVCVWPGGQVSELWRSAIQYPDFSAALFETEDGGPSRAAGAEHQHFRVFDGEALLQRTNHAGGVGIETVELALLSADDGIAGADLAGERVVLSRYGRMACL